LFAALIASRAFDPVEETEPPIRVTAEESEFVDSSVRSAPEEIVPVVKTDPHWIDRAPVVVMAPLALLLKDPELQVTVIPDRPLIAPLTNTFPPVEVRVNELDELVEATALDTVIPPLLSTTRLLAVISETK
jgi:hypothetical protein